MTNFTATVTLTTQQNLATGEVGYVARNGAVLTPIGIGVIMTGSSSLMVLGAVGSNSTAVLGQALNGAHLTVAESGIVIGSSGAGFSVGIAGDVSLTNAGQISGSTGISAGLSLAASAFSLVNTGVITGVGDGAGINISSSVAGSSFRLDNSGTISTSGADRDGLKIAGLGDAQVTNSGTISAADGWGVQSAASISLLNTGTILGGVTVTGRAQITQSGQILGNVILGVQSDVVRVSGLIEGFVSLGTGNNDFYLSGGWVTGIVQGGSGSDRYYIDRSDVTIQDGSGGFDTVISSASFKLAAGIEELNLIGPLGLRGTGAELDETITGTVGDDTVIGLGGDDYLIAEEGNNQVFGGAGDDTMAARDGDDLMQAHAGNDLIYLWGGADTVRGGLGVDTLRLGPTAVGGLETKVNLATGTATLDGETVARLGGIENVFGYVANDSLTGDAGANELQGHTGDDTLLGGGGADTLEGETGADVMTGGAGADVFVFDTTAASTVGSGVDLINGFVVGVDRIALSEIDATPGGLNDAFAFVGTAAFTGNGPQLRFVQDAGAGTTTIEGRLGNASVVSMTIVLDGLIALTATDFIL